MVRARLVIALALFATVAIATFALPSHQWDAAATMWLQLSAPAPDVPASIFVFLGDAEVTIPAAVAAGLLASRRAPAAARTALWLAAGMTVTSFIALALKFVVPHLGPPAQFQRPVAHAGLALPQPYSFPSGHTMRVTFLAASVLRRAPVAGAALILAMMTALVY